MIRITDAIAIDEGTRGSPALERLVEVHAFETGSGKRVGLGAWLTYYNTDRPHSAVGGYTLGEAT